MLKLEIFLVILPMFTTWPWDCYNRKCGGTGKYASYYVVCDNSDYYCSTGSTSGYPGCYYRGRKDPYGNGANCPGECNWDETTGIAFCKNPTNWDCYDMKCKGQDSYTSSYITCDNQFRYCSITSYGRPRCVYNRYRNYGNGVNCTMPYTCNWNETTGTAFCNERTHWDCYDKKCKKKDPHSGSYIACNNEHSYCLTDQTGYPSCVYTGGTTYGNGVNCTNREFGCGWDNNTGVAFCYKGYKLKQNWNCYDRKCRGQGYNAHTYVDCNNEYNYCSTDDYGLPKCSDTGYINGVNCELGKQHCSWNDKSGVAFCEENSKTSTKSTSIVKILVVSTVSVIVVVLIGYCCCVYRKVFEKRMRNGYDPNVELEEPNAPDVQGSTLTTAATSTQQPATTDNRLLGTYYVPTSTKPLATERYIQLSTLPPPDYQTQHNYPQQLQDCSETERAPPSYEQCVSNIDKF